MEITQAPYEPLAPVLPVRKGNVKLSNLQVLNAILYVAEHGRKWRGLPPRFGNWHTVYTRMNRWSKNGVLDRVFEHLQRETCTPSMQQQLSAPGQPAMVANAIADATTVSESGA